MYGKYKYLIFIQSVTKIYVNFSSFCSFLIFFCFFFAYKIILTLTLIPECLLIFSRKFSAILNSSPVLSRVIITKFESVLPNFYLIFYNQSTFEHVRLYILYYHTTVSVIESYQMPNEIHNFQLPINKRKRSEKNKGVTGNFVGFHIIADDFPRSTDYCYNLFLGRPFDYYFIR